MKQFVLFELPRSSDSHASILWTPLFPSKIFHAAFLDYPDLNARVSILNDTVTVAKEGRCFMGLVSVWIAQCIKTTTTRAHGITGFKRTDTLERHKRQFNVRLLTTVVYQEDL